MVDMKDIVMVSALCLIGIILVCGIFSSFVYSEPGSMENKEIAANNTKITVGGIARETIAADMAVFTVEIETSDGNSRMESQRKNAEITKSVKESLLSNGVLEEQISTGRYRLWEMYSYNQDTETYEFSSYATTHSLQVKTDKIDNLGGIIDDVISNGANDVRNIRWSLSEDKRKETERKLFADALENAEAKVLYAFPDAEDITMVEVTDSSVIQRLVYNPGYTFAAAGYTLEDDVVTTEFYTGSIALNSRVTAVFEIPDNK